MSQIAQGFACSSNTIAKANTLCRLRNRRAMAEALLPSQVVAFGHGGYVIAVIAEWLKSQNVVLPKTIIPDSADLIELEDPLLCATQAEVIAVWAAMRSLSPKPEELAAFWSEWTGESTAEALTFMPAGLAWLTGVAEAGTHSDWCLVLSG